MWKTFNIFILVCVFMLNSPAISAENNLNNEISNITFKQSDGYLQVLILKSGMSVVMEEGRLQARSISSQVAS